MIYCDDCAMEAFPIEIPRTSIKEWGECAVCHAHTLCNGGQGLAQAAQVNWRSRGPEWHLP